MAIEDYNNEALLETSSRQKSRELQLRAGGGGGGCCGRVGNKNIKRRRRVFIYLFDK